METLITVIAPMYNEEALVREYISETKKELNKVSDSYNYEVLFVNDGSTDGTFAQMLQAYQEDPRHIGIVNLTRNFGLEGAIYAGLSVARGDIVVVMDADLQDPPRIILEMIKEYERGADIVIANRKKRVNDSWFKRNSALVYYKILSELSGKIHLEQGAANFRLLSRAAVEKLKALPEVNGVFRVTVPFLGMKTATVEYDRDKRYAGKTKYNLNSMIRYALDSITGISVEPLRKIVWFIFFTGVLLIGNIIGMVIGGNEWRGIFYLASLMTVLFFCAFGVLALLGEYIAQIMIETKGRPTSLIYEYIPAEREGKHEK